MHGRKLGNVSGIDEKNRNEKERTTFICRRLNTPMAETPYFDEHGQYITVRAT